MTTNKNVCSVCVAIKGNEKIYLSNRDIENGLDVKLDLLGYEIIAL